MKQVQLSKERQAQLLIAVVLLAVLFFAYAFEQRFSHGVSGVGDARLKAAAERVLDACAQKSYKPSCYDAELPKLMDEGFSMEDSFKVTALVQEQDRSYYYCHVLGHNLSSKETAKDPGEWAQVVGRCPVGQCSNGCLHGAFQERFRDDVLSETQINALLPQLMPICEQGNERDFTGLEQASCYHALGHLAMYITGANATLATGVCDKVAKQGGEDYTQTCYEGAYMQIFQPLEPEDFALVKDIAPVTQGAAEKMCDTYTGVRRAACHRESWPLYREDLEDADGLQHFCGLVNDPANIQRCYNSAFYVLTAQFNFNEARITKLCEALPTEVKAQCFANSASRHIETDYRLIPQAVALCKTADKDGVGDRCYNELLFYSSFNFHEGSDAFNTLCRALPDPWGSRCFAGDGKNAHPASSYQATSTPARSSEGYTTDSGL